MIKYAVTVCLFPEGRAGPFVFHGDLEAACQSAAEIGFAAVELFPRAAAEFDRRAAGKILAAHQLAVAAIGSGAGWVTQGLSLTDPAASVRRRALEFVRALIEVAGDLGAPVIIGSMQGRFAAQTARADGLGWLGEAVTGLAQAAVRQNQVLLLEPLNRYETNVWNTIAETVAFIRSIAAPNVRVLCDLFHMNLEEAHLDAALKAAGTYVGHVHFADSNRRAMGLGHTDAAPVAAALRELGYGGYVSAEILPLPDSEQAARQALRAFRQFFDAQEIRC